MKVTSGMTFLARLRFSRSTGGARNAEVVSAACDNSGASATSALLFVYSAARCHYSAAPYLFNCS